MTSHERVVDCVRGRSRAALERDVLAALAAGPLSARQVARRAGYVYNSHLRAVLAALLRRRLVRYEVQSWADLPEPGPLRGLYRLAEE